MYMCVWGAFLRLIVIHEYMQNSCLSRVCYIVISISEARVGASSKMAVECEKWCKTFLPQQEHHKEDVQDQHSDAQVH